MICKVVYTQKSLGDRSGKAGGGGNRLKSNLFNLPIVFINLWHGVIIAIDRLYVPKIVDVNYNLRIPKN